MKKLRAEINDLVVTDEELSRTDLRNLHYLQNILKESKSYPLLRLKGPLGLDSTQLNQLFDFTLLCLLIHVHRSRPPYSPPVAAPTVSHRC